jgi:hypothetical protein
MKLHLMEETLMIISNLDRALNDTNSSILAAGRSGIGYFLINYFRKKIMYFFSGLYFEILICNTICIQRILS